MTRYPLFALLALTLCACVEPVQVDGGTYALGDPGSLPTYRELLEGAPVLPGTNTRSEALLACDEYPARPEALRDPCPSFDVVEHVPCPTCTRPSVLVRWACSGAPQTVTTQVPYPCGCEEFTISSDGGLVLCESGESWDHVAVLGLR